MIEQPTEEEYRRWKRWKPDAYGAICNDETAQRARRHPKCRCPVPCQNRFICVCPGHLGLKATPLCNGAADKLPDWCDTCVMREG